MECKEVAKWLTWYALPYSDSIVRLWLQDKTKKELEFILQELAHAATLCKVFKNQLCSKDPQIERKERIERHLKIAYQYFKQIK